MHIPNHSQQICTYYSDTKAMHRILTKTVIENKTCVCVWDCCGQDVAYVTNTIVCIYDMCMLHAGCMLRVCVYVCVVMFVTLRVYILYPFIGIKVKSKQSRQCNNPPAPHGWETPRSETVTEMMKRFSLTLTWFNHFCWAEDGVEATEGNRCFRSRAGQREEERRTCH